MGGWIIDLTQIQNMVDLILSCVIIFVVIFVAFKCHFSIFGKVSVCLLSLSLLFTCLFQLHITQYFIFIISVAVILVSCFVHIGAIRGFFQKFSKNNIVKKVKPEKIIDHQVLYDEVFEAVSACSRSKTGALITFEKHDNLLNQSKNGTMVNAPVTHELLMTIFYPGTRLHDGAVIIKDGKILAASVYYTPTTKALTGKYGSRHRAAIGISEVSDSITVVVSEETGRVSIAHAGELEPVSLDRFIETLTEYMSLGE